MKLINWLLEKMWGLGTDDLDDGDDKRDYWVYFTVLGLGVMFFLVYLVLKGA